MLVATQSSGLLVKEHRENIEGGGLRGRVIWPRRRVTIRTIQRFCHGHLRIRVHTDYLLPGRLIPSHTWFFQMLVWVCCGMYGVVDRVDVVCYADKPVSVLRHLSGLNFQPFFFNGIESWVSLALNWSRFQGYHTLSGFLAVLMVRFDFSMDIPIKKHFEFATSLYSDQPSKMAVIERNKHQLPHQKPTWTEGYQRDS